MRVTTNLVQIDVVVTDKNGRHVTDLSAEDFEVSEDGKKRQVTNFSYIAAGGASATGVEAAATPVAPSKKGAEPVMQAQLKREQVRRTVALVIDDLGLSFESFGYARQALRWNPQGRGSISPTGTMNEQSIGADIRHNIQFMEEAEETRAGQYSVGTIGTMNAIVQSKPEFDITSLGTYGCRLALTASWSRSTEH